MAQIFTDALRRILTAVDSRLSGPANVVLLGGAVLLLKLRTHHATRDLDYIPGLTSEEFVRVCVDVAAAEQVPVQPVTIFLAPDGYEERLESIQLGLQRLRVFIPEKHDFAMMKIARGTEHDLQAIEELHREGGPLDLQIRIERYHEMYTTGRRSDFRLSFLAAVEKLFGEHVAIALEQPLCERDRAAKYPE